MTFISSRLAVSIQGISRLGSAFIFLRWLKFAHICIQVHTLHMWDKQEILRFDISKSISKESEKICWWIPCLSHTWRVVTWRHYGWMKKKQHQFQVLRNAVMRTLLVSNNWMTYFVDTPTASTVVFPWWFREWVYLLECAWQQFGWRYSSKPWMRDTTAQEKYFFTLLPPIFQDTSMCIFNVNNLGCYGNPLSLCRISQSVSRDSQEQKRTELALF